MRRLILLAMLFAAPAHASLVRVPDDFASVQAAIDSGPDSIFVAGTYALAENVTLSAYVTIVGEGGSHPALGHVFFNMPDEYNSPNVKLQALGLAGCSTSQSRGFGEITLADCLSSGTIQIRYGRIVIEDMTLLPGFGMDLEGTFAHVGVTNARVSDVVGTGIRARGGEASVWIMESVVERCAEGGIVVLSTGGSGTRIERNVVRDCLGDGIQSGGFSAVTVGNRVERCGRGIINRWSGGSTTGNVVLACTGDGMVATGAFQNTIALCGGNGITPPDTSYNGPNTYNGATSNVVAFNSGIGIARPDANMSCNVVWANGIDSKLGAICADPKFCDLAAGDLHVASSSPALGGGCGPIGALGAGCATRDALVAQSETGAFASESTLDRPFGIKVRGRVALVTLGGAEIGTLEVLDIAGRRISRNILTGSGEVPIHAPAGVVFLRLEQGARNSTAKVVMMR